MFLIIRNIFRIHPFFYIFMFICFFTGHIRDFFLFFSIIIVHEFGHILFGLLFSWNVDRVIILPFGCVTVFNSLINTSLFEQFIVTLMGPIFQIIFYFVISHCFVLDCSVSYLNFFLLIFNLLPIFPLDGSKFLYVFLCFIFPFRLSYFLLCLFSFLFIFFVILFVGHFDFIIYICLLFLFFRTFFEFRNRRIIFNKFLFERYNYDFSFRYVRRVNCIGKMYLWCRHLFSDGGMYVTEREKLLKMFDNRYKL